MEHDHNYAKIPDGENNEIPSEEEDLGGSTSHSDLTPDQIIFVVSNRLPYKDLMRQWTKIFNTAPPSCRTVDRHWKDLGKRALSRIAELARNQV